MIQDSRTACYTMHVVAHSHWDREWYLPFQEHRRRLVALLDEVLNLLERDPSFTSFHLDGQVIMLDDYLEIRPWRRADLERQVRAGRLIIGPWYVQPDEFLVSGEALVRNMLLGLRKGQAYGGAARIGYLPDTFGHIGQMPQLLRGFDIDNAIFGRGLPVLDEAAGDPRPAPFASEMAWEAPDGSRVLGVVLATWYNNAVELPTEPEAAVARLRGIRDAAARFATTRHLLLMNGMDHQPVQTDLPAALAAAVPGIQPDIAAQDSIPGYVAALRAATGDGAGLCVVTGELRGQGTDGWMTVADTASARLYLKRMNHDAQVALERYAEPLAACARLLGASYPGDLLRYAWTRLIQNHPHDSICGCSIDQVHDDMLPRFRDSLAVAHLVARESAAYLGAVLATPVDRSVGALSVLVFNMLAWPRGGLVTLDVDVARRACGVYPGPAPAPEDLTPLDVTTLRLRTAEGEDVPCAVEDLGVVWDYALPPDRTRQPFYARRVRVSVHAPDVPGLGYRQLILAPRLASVTEADSTDDASAVRAGPRWLENAHLRVEVADDGALTVVDKATGERYAGLNVYEDCGDVGDEYIFRAPAGDVPLTTARLPAHCAVVEETPIRATLRVVQTLPIPAHAEPPEPGRGQGRSRAMVDLCLETMLVLTAASRAVEVTARLDNTARDHRLRALFPTDVQARTCVVDNAFDVVERVIAPWAGWTNPTNAQPQQEFVALIDKHRGVLIANRGLPEYEVLRDERGTIALTLLRSVGHLGDWGIFPTPGAQCLGPWEASYAIMPCSGDWQEGARLAREFVTPLYASQISSSMEPSRQASLRQDRPGQGSVLRVDGTGIVLSACKSAEDGESVIVRLYNPTGNPVSPAVQIALPLAAAYAVTLEERRLASLTLAADARSLTVEMGPKAIVTMQLIPVDLGKDAEMPLA